MKPGAKPFFLYTPRRVPLPLRQKVEDELNRMESMGVISKVDSPTPWCAGMVVAPKKSGAIRICVDLKPLNQNVMREVHPLPRVDNTLAQLTGAKLFSKLDANSGFWQIPLSPTSRLLTTFIDHTCRAILFQQIAVRNIQCPRALPKANEQHPNWSERSSVSHG